jgi:hypothetical protein
VTNMVASENISGIGREIPKVDYLCPAHQAENPANQTTGELGEQSFGWKHSLGVQELQELQEAEE